MESLYTHKKVEHYVFDLTKPLGQGCYGIVYKANNLETKIDCAVKVIPMSLIKSDEARKSLIMNEVNVLKRIKGEHFVTLEDLYRTENFLYIFMDYCDGGSLQAMLNREKQLTEKEACSIVKQIAKAFLDIQKLRTVDEIAIMHRDIKPDNIMFHQGKVKIADFGFAKAFKKDFYDENKLQNHTIVGTPLYAPLEILEGKPYGSKCDIWSTGILFFQLIHGKCPWDGETKREFIIVIKKRKLEFSPKLKPEIQKLISSMLEFEECKRASWQEVHEILEHYENQTEVSEVVDDFVLIS